jgi:hypothetical protein
VKLEQLGIGLAYLSTSFHVGLLPVPTWLRQCSHLSLPELPLDRESQVPGFRAACSRVASAHRERACDLIAGVVALDPGENALLKSSVRDYH